MATPGRRLTSALEHERLFWGTAILLYGIGDIAVTAFGLQDEEVAEAGPIALYVLGQAGLTGLFALKVVFFLVCFLIWFTLESPARSAIPLAIAVVGFLVVTWNVGMLVT